MRITFLCICIGVCFFSCKDPSNDEKSPVNNPPISTTEAIANAYGYPQWKNIESVSFTFNIDRGESHFERSFVWQPKLEKVHYLHDTDTLTYNRKDPLDSLQMAADRRFINDKYWLLAPFQLMWDQNLTFSEQKNIKAPISKEIMNRLTAVYPSEGGYTPGDAYDFYYTDDFLIREWVFREANQPEPTIITTWENILELNDMKFTLSHKDSTGGFHLYFSNLSIK